MRLCGEAIPIEHHPVLTRKGRALRIMMPSVELAGARRVEVCICRSCGVLYVPSWVLEGDDERTNAT